MPEFGFNEQDLQGVTAYLLDVSDKDYKLNRIFEEGDAEKGEKLFKTVGCQACHTLNGKGENHAPDLRHIAQKVNADWLVTW